MTDEKLNGSSKPEGPKVHPVAQKVFEALAEHAVMPSIATPGPARPHPAIEGVGVALSAVFAFSRDVGIPRAVALELAFQAMMDLSLRTAAEQVERKVIVPSTTLT